jgi:hypothetical protein
MGFGCGRSQVQQRPQSNSLTRSQLVQLRQMIDEAVSSYALAMADRLQQDGSYLKESLQVYTKTDAINFLRKHHNSIITAYTTRILGKFDEFAQSWDYASRQRIRNDIQELIDDEFTSDLLRSADEARKFDRKLR